MLKILRWIVLVFLFGVLAFVAVWLVERAFQRAATMDTSDDVDVVFPAESDSYLLVSDQTTVSFEIGEILSGAQNQVIGTSTDVSGAIRADLDRLQEAQVSVVRVDAGSFVTDNIARDAAIQRAILDADEYPEITFTPAAVLGLPERAEIGESISVTIPGELVIRDIVQTVSFEGVIQFVNEDRIDGQASTTVTRSDYGLTIPSVPFVAEVDEDVVLSIQFAAVRR